MHVFIDENFTQVMCQQLIWTQIMTGNGGRGGCYGCYRKLEFFNPRRACAARVTVLGSVCLSVCLSHLTYGVSVHPENAVTCSAGNEG